MSTVISGTPEMSPPHAPGDAIRGEHPTTRLTTTTRLDSIIIIIIAFECVRESYAELDSAILIDCSGAIALQVG